jgi:ribose/xylose/arabinose/galactoside ABC-type transport system permease subunit
VSDQTSRLLRFLMTGRNQTINYLILLLVALVVCFSLALQDTFLSLGTLQSMAFQLPELGVLALAMMITLLCGGINLSIIATANLTSLTIGYVLTHVMPADWATAAGIGTILLAFAAGLAVAGLIGLLNGVIIAYVGVSPILATLGTMTMVKGISIGLTHGNVISGFPEPILFIGNGVVLGVPMAVIVFALCAAPLALLLNRTPFGIAIYMIGSNERSTRFSGIDTRRVLLRVYVLSSLLCGVAALVMMSRFNSANAAYGESYLLITILAAVLGGVDPFGGFGRVMGLVLALIILQVISSGLNLLGLSAHLTLAIWGAILILVMAVGYLNVRLGGRAAR